ncbi:MAG: glucosyltransferase I RfaG [Gammaproteobacteria bacterium]|nr:glucosyltransferase I RfaG [Gammaproteobacteria bacterium]RPG25891.1 MAG: glycosyltransferase [Gammaproteobacteria bacterium TMED50]
MTFVFLLYKYFPYGGLQRDFLRITRECQRRGHQVRVYTLTWDGDMPNDLDVTVVPVDALFNHVKYQRFTDWVRNALAVDPVDCVVGFNKMPGLDIYYAADSCYEEKARSQRPWPYRLLPRYHHFSAYEDAVFGVRSSTKILMISNAQMPYFLKHYGTRQNRMQLLPPGISRDRIAPLDADDLRRRVRESLGIEPDENIILFVGSGFIKKGLSRAILAIASLPEQLLTRTRMLVIGEDRARPFERMIKRLGLSDHIELLGGRADVPQYLLAGNLLLHPASDENAGMVLLEAMVAGLPVLATDVCGYGHYVVEADMGALVSRPFYQEELNQKLTNMLLSSNDRKWRGNGRDFAETADIYSLPVAAVTAIEKIMQVNEPSTTLRVSPDPSTTKPGPNQLSS